MGSRLRVAVGILVMAMMALMIPSVRSGNVVSYDFGTNDTAPSIYPWVGLLLTPDQSAVSSCSANTMYTYGFYNCPAIKIDHAQLGFPASYADRLILTTEYCANISTPVAGETRTITFDYNPAASITYIGATLCPENPFRVVNVNRFAGNIYYNVTMLALINDNYKYPSGMAIGINGAGDLAILALDVPAYGIPSASIEMGLQGMSVPSTLSVAAHMASYSYKGQSSVWIDSPQRKYGVINVISSRSDSFTVDQNPHKNLVIDSMSAAPAVTDVTNRTVIGLYNAASHGQALTMYERIDTPYAWSFFRAAAAWYVAGNSNPLIITSLQQPQQQQQMLNFATMGGLYNTAPKIQVQQQQQPAQVADVSTESHWSHHGVDTLWYARAAFFTALILGLAAIAVAVYGIWRINKKLTKSKK